MGRGRIERVTRDALLILLVLLALAVIGRAVLEVCSFPDLSIGFVMGAIALELIRGDD